MAGWLTALKLVPWGKVIEATPQITKAARELLQNRRKSSPQVPIEPPQNPSDEARLLLQLQQQMQQLQEQQRASAQLIESLAEQNAQLVLAVSQLRLRSRWLALALLLVVVWGAWRYWA